MKPKNPITGDEWETNIVQAVSVIQKNETFLFCADLDPDSIGSMLSMALYFRLLGKKVYMVISESLGDSLDFFDKIIQFNSIKVLSKPDDIIAVREEIDAIIFFDSANTKLVPHYSTIAAEVVNSNLPVVEIDHHFGADSEEMTEHGIKLFRRANANTEIIAELLSRLRDENPEFPNPFYQRNILLALITGILGDTLGGKVVPLKEDYDYWMDTLGSSLGSVTRWRDSKEGRPGDDRKTKFGSPDSIFGYMNRMDEEKQMCIDTLTKRIEVKGGVGLLNLMSCIYPQVKEICRDFDSDWFNEVRGFLLNVVPEKAGKVGIVYYNGKNAEGEACIFLKMRRAVDYAGFDLRMVEDQARQVFDDGRYMGGGGHPGAVSFRVLPMDSSELHPLLDKIISYINANLA